MSESIYKFALKVVKFNLKQTIELIVFNHNYIRIV